jgi:hypothetical protein
MNFSVEDCKVWLASGRTINPITRRSIKENGSIYRTLNSQAIRYGLTSTSGGSGSASTSKSRSASKSESKCEHKWITLTSDEAGEYDNMRHVITCVTCSKLCKALHFMHAVTDYEEEDYICVRCGESGSLRYVCTACRNSRTSRTGSCLSASCDDNQVQVQARVQVQVQVQ